MKRALARFLISEDDGGTGCHKEIELPFNFPEPPTRSSTCDEIYEIALAECSERICKFLMPEKRFEIEPGNFIYISECKTSDEQEYEFKIINDILVFDKGEQQ